MDKEFRDNGLFTVEELKLFDQGVLSIENFIHSDIEIEGRPFIIEFRLEAKLRNYFTRRINFDQKSMQEMQEKIANLILRLDR